MFRMIIFLGGLFCVYTGFKKITTNSTPYTGTVLSAETADLKNYDYFKLSKGVMLPYAFYEQSVATKQITEFVYPLVSQEYYDRIGEKYGEYAAEQGITEFNDGHFWQ